MRIIIEIDGGEMTVKTYPSQTTPTPFIQAPAVLPTPAGPAPPPEVLRAAAALGAIDAGPAPTGSAFVTPPPEVLRAAAALGAIDAGPAPTGSAFVTPIQPAGEGVPGAGTHDVDAGAAPDSPPGGGYGPR